MRSVQAVALPQVMASMQAAAEGDFSSLRGLRGSPSRGPCRDDSTPLSAELGLGLGSAWLAIGSAVCALAGARRAWPDPSPAAARNRSPLGSAWHGQRRQAPCTSSGPASCR